MGARKKSYNGPKPSPPAADAASFPHSIPKAVQLEEDLTYLEMSNMDSEELKVYAQEQRDMYYVVYSIYKDGFERVYGKRSPWQKKDNLAFSVSLSSTLDKDILAKVEFEIPTQFPTLPVKAKLLALRPRTKYLETKINEALSTYPEANRHEGAITETLDIVQESLDREATENEIATKGMSLEDERAHQEAAARDDARAQREHELRIRESEEIESEKRLQEALLKERQRRHGQYGPQEQASHDTGADEDVSEVPFRFKDRIKWYNPATKETLIFSAVFGPRVLLQRRDKKVTLVHPVKFGKLQPSTFILKEIFLPDYLATKAEYETAMDAIRNTLEDCKTMQHPNIARLYAYQIEHDTTPEELSEWKITILTEKSDESGILVGLKMSECFKPRRVRLWTEQILRGMDFLDKLGHPHPAVHLGNVLCWHAEGDELAVKLTDGYGAVLRRLVDKVREQEAPPVQTPTGWLPPELIAGGEGITNKTCVWQLGIVVIKMAFSMGLKLEEIHTSVEPLLKRDDLRDSFKAFLRSVFQTIPRRRPSAEELLSNQMLKDGTQGFNIPTRENPSDEPHLLRSGELATANSNWNNLFIEATPLGKGSFGQVFRARYLTDNQLYAVKRLMCASKEDVKLIWSEVRMLAQLNHSGIVRYYNAWQEDEQVEDRVLDHVAVHQPSVAGQSVRNRLVDPSTQPAVEHDFMDPSMHRYVGPDAESDQDQDEDDDEDSDEDDGDDEDDEDDDDDGGNMFAYQSPGEDTEEEADAVLNDSSANLDVSDDFNIATTSNGMSYNIQFGNDTSSAGKTRNTTSEVQSPSPVQRTPARTRSQRSILYIQMELCQDGTLRDLISDGLPNRTSEVWRVFRDILEALQHIHQYGVVHRDLKPTNIFIDQRGRTKIGDFGLAIASQLGADLRHEKILNAGSDRGVGTQWYVAPELEVQGSGQYSSKADMFSLGVIFFQMCMPITTAFERQNYLTRISKEPNFDLPPFFDEENHQSQGRIIRSLISHDQNLRPSCKELLLDPAIPENVEDAAIERHLTRMAINDPDKYAELIDKMYEKASSYTRAQDLAWQNRGHKSDFVERVHPVASTAVNDQLKEIFCRHAAVESDRSSPFPRSNIYTNAAELMDDNIVLQLPFDLTFPFARMLADPDERPEYPKNYCFGTVYRRAHRGIAPAKLPEVDYDHVSFSAKDLSLKDAEVIKVLDEVLTEQPALVSRSFSIVLNHGDLLDTILKYARIDEAVWDNVKRELSALNVRRIEWKHVRDQLLSPRYAISQTSVSRLQKFDFHGDIVSVKKRIGQMLDEDHFSKAVKTFARLEELAQYIELFGIKTSVQFAPLSNNTEQLYRGSIMFKAIENKSRKILAVGGRYDKLIEELSFNVPKGSVRAVGFRINISVLNVYVMAEEQKRQTGKQSIRDARAVPARADVVITSFDEATLHGPCLEIYRDLLACGIKAELSEQFNNMTELDKHYKDINYWLVIVRPGPRIKVRNLSREEIDVRQSELITHIKSELGERNATAPAPDSRLRRMTSSHGDKATQRVSVCVPSHKDKKANRAVIVDAAASAAQELSEELATNAPIIAISTKDEVLELMRNTRLADDSTWRALRQSVSATERQYLAEVQELLKAKAEEENGARGAFVVNYRTNTCFFYDFGKK